MFWQSLISQPLVFKGRMWPSHHKLCANQTLVVAMEILVVSGDVKADQLAKA